MNKLNLFSFSRTIFLKLFFLVVFSPLVFSGGDDDIYTQINRNMDVYGKLYKEIMLEYVDEIDGDKFMKSGIDGMLSTLDPYTNFLDESRKDEVDLITTGKYGGIGISVAMKDSAIVITETLEGYTAQKEGLKRGDKIIDIDGTSLEGKKLGDVRALTRGEPGTTLKMKVLRGDKEMDFTLTRQEIQLKNVTYHGVIEGGIGYIKLERFNKYAENEMIEALNDITSKGEPSGIIVDLRNNPGGLLDAAIGILDKFIEKGNLLLTTRGRMKDSERKYFASEKPMAGKDIPLVILINENSASASEIFAGAVQDLDRGVIVGTKSFGKGLVQVYTPLSYGNQLKITNQKYFTPSGRWIQSKNYFKDNIYGVFKPDPYFNQTEFKTLGGRIVYPEGGITPDSVIDIIKNNELLEALYTNDMYYKFASDFVISNPDGNGFAMNDDVVSRFYSFLATTEFEFKTKAETELSHLKKEIADKNYSESVKSSIAALETEMQAERLRDFDNSRKAISRQLETEILKKYNKPEKIITETGIKDDDQLQAALSIIKDKQLYNRFLEVK